MFFFFKRLRRTKKAATCIHFLGRRAQKVARPKTRVALRATRPSAAVAKNGDFDLNVAPAQQLIKSVCTDDFFIPGTRYHTFFLSVASSRSVFTTRTTHQAFYFVRRHALQREINVGEES